VRRPLGQDYYPVRQEDHLRDAVRDDDDRDADSCPKVQQLEIETISSEFIQRAKRLIHQEYLRIDRQRSSDGHTLLHPARQLVRVLVLVINC
jgi:hypothetical protein